MGRKHDRKPTKPENLAEAMMGVYTTGAKDKAAMRELIITSVISFKQGSGMIWGEMDELLDALYDTDLEEKSLDNL